jgi:hypothetical protein
MDYDEGYVGIEANPGDTVGLLITSSSYFDLFEYRQHPFILTAEVMLEAMSTFGGDEEISAEEQVMLEAMILESFPAVLNEGVTRDSVTTNVVASAIRDSMGTYNWLFTYTVREDAPDYSIGTIMVPAENLEDEPMFTIEIYI